LFSEKHRLEFPMADREGGGAPWLAFLAGVVLVAVIAFGIVAYNGGFQQRETAELEVTLPEVDVPDIDLPEPPDPPALPPRADGEAP
jgi:hypothetical protein